MRKAFLGFFLAVTLVFAQGCNGLQEAQRVENVLAGLITLAQSEVSVVPPQDKAIFQNYIALAGTLDGQLKACISGVSGVTGQSKKFLACFNAFATGLTSPAELAQLRLLSPSAQNRVQLYVTAVITGVNVALSYFGGSAATPPTVSTTPPTSAELHDLGLRVGVNWGQ